MVLIHALLFSLIVGTAVAGREFFALKGSIKDKILDKRQDAEPAPIPVSCGVGETCEIACGPGYIDCGDPAAGLCYNPADADACCAPNPLDPWLCLGGDYCLVNHYCCPGSSTPDQCALNFSQTLGPDFVFTPPTTTVTSSSPLDPAITVVTTNSAEVTISSPRTTTASAGTATRSSSVASATADNAATSNTISAGASLIYGLLALMGNLL